MVAHSAIDHTGLPGISGGGYDEGTSFPGSPSTGDLFHRTDLDIALWRYDGTRWLCTCQHRDLIASGPTAVAPYSVSGTVAGRWAPWHTTYDVWLDAFYVTHFIITTNNGSNYWTVTLLKYQSDGGTSATVASRTTAADAASTVVTAEVAINALLVPATYKLMQVELTKTGTPGNMTTPSFAVSYRLVGT